MSLTSVTTNYTLVCMMRRNASNTGTSKPVRRTKGAKQSVTAKDLIFFLRHPEELKQLNEAVAAWQHLPLLKAVQSITRWTQQMERLQQSLQQIGQARGCAVCDSLFIPVRRDQKCCSKQCAGLLRVRRWRKRQARYEQNRKLRVAGVQSGSC
jgi:predicted nucleic acid-binding Zn ribbon protein